MKNIYFNLNQLALKTDGEPTVNRQSRLMLRQGKRSENGALSSTCLRSALVPLSFRSRYLRYAAMIFAVLVMSVANVGMAWGAITPKTISSSTGEVYMVTQSNMHTWYNSGNGWVTNASGGAITSASYFGSKTSTKSTSYINPETEATGTDTNVTGITLKTADNRSARFYFTGATAVYAFTASTGTSRSSTLTVYKVSDNTSVGTDSEDASSTSYHKLTVTGLSASESYYAKVTATNDMILYAMKFFAPAAAPRTFKSGEKIYFKDASGNISGLSCLWKVSSGNVYGYFYDDAATPNNAWSTYGDNVAGSWNAANAIYEITVPQLNGVDHEWTGVLFTRGSAATWGDGYYGQQTSNQTPDIGQNMFIMSTAAAVDSKYNGSWSKYAPNPVVLGDFNDWDPDQGVLDGSNRLIVDLEASTAYGFKVLIGDGSVLDNWYGLNSGNITNTTSSWWTLKSKENNCTVTSGEAGEYCFHWNNSDKQIGIYFPQARLTKNTYLYFNGNANTSWNGKDPYHAKYSYKYYDSGNEQSYLFSSNENSPESHIYYTVVPNNDYIGRVQVMCMYTDHSTQHYYANVTQAYDRTSSTQNCLIAPSAGSDGINLTWGTYCPPTKSETFTDNSTSVISWTSGTGTSENPYLVPTSGTIKVQASASKTVADGNMTINYDFKKDGTSKQAGTGTTYSLGSLSNNTTYTMSVDVYTVYNLDGEQNSTKHTPTALYYKALTTYSVTHNVNHASSSDRTGSGAAAYYLPYSATFTPATGYNLPATITVKFGSSTKTSGTDYTWNSSTGVLTIPASKIDGDVTIKFDGVAKTTAITLDPNTANHGTAGDGSAVATYDATSLTSVTHTTPAADYQLKGYYTAKTDGTKIINADGSFVTATTTYTTSDGKWKSELAELTLYAQYEEIEYCYTHTLATSGSAPADYDVIAGTYSGGIMEKIGGTLTYGTNGLNFESGNSSKVSVALENNMQAGSVVTIVMVTESNSARGLIIANSSGTAKATYSESTSGTYTKTYKVVAGDGLAGSNVFQVHRNNNARLKSIKVGNCGSAATKYNLAMSLTNVSQTSSWVAGGGKVVTGSNFTATFEAADCYLLPATITVTIGGASKTAGTDYYWTQATGKLVIPGSNVTGNIAITISGTDNHSAAGLSYGTASVSKKTTDGKFTNSLSNPNSLTVSYESDDEDVATVDSDGEVTIKGVGSCTITASADAQDCYNSGSASYTLTVSDLSDEKKLKRLVFSNSFDALIDESSHTVKAYYLYGTSAPTISSYTVSDKASYSIDGTTITVTAEDGSTQDYELTLSSVTPYAGTGSEETFIGSETYIKGGRYESSMWTFQKNDGGDREVSGRNRLYFFVDECSKITLKSGGDSRAMKVYRNGVELATPTASGSNGSTIDIEGAAGAAMYALVSNQESGSGKFTSITITPRCTDPGLAYAIGSVTKTLCDASFTNALTNTNSVSVSYESSDTDVAEVASDGAITIKAAGTTTITASFDGDATYCEDDASYTLTVNASTAAGLAYGTSTVKKDVGDDAFTNTLTNSNSLSVTYSSSNEDVATIDSDGEVTIKAAGTTTITASSAQQKVSSTCYAAGSATYTLTVYPIYTVTYNAMGGTCSPTSTNTTTALGKVILPSATHASYTTYSWVTSDGTEAGDAGDNYEPSGNVTLYAKWQGSCAGGGGSGTTIYKALIKTSGLNTDKTTIEGLSGAQSFTTSNYLSELDGGTLTLNINTAGQATVQKDSMIRITNVATYWTITLTGGKSLQAGDIIRTRIKNQIGYLQKTSGDYSATTDVALTKNTEYVTIVPNSLVGATTLYLKAAVSNMDLTYVEIYRPSETLLYMHVNDGLTNGNIDTEETKQTAGESNLLRAVSGGDVYTGATTAGHIKIVNTSEIQLNNNTGYIKLVLPKALAEGDVLYFRSSHDYQLAITSGDSRDATIHTANKTYTIPKSSTLIDKSTIYLWYYSSAANVKTLAVVRPNGGSSCYTVTYDGNDATSGYVNDPEQYAKDADPEILTCGYTKTGYAFMGWADGTDHRDAGTVDYQPGDHITSISDDVTLYAIWKQIKYFTGAASSTSWNASGNWSPIGAPTITDPVVIQANTEVDIVDAKALRVDIQSGNTLTINAGKALIIAETLTKAGGATAAADVIINSTRAAGVGALIIGGETGTNKATVNFATKAKNDGGWVNQFIGSPFSDNEPYVDYALQLYKFVPRANGDRGWWSTVHEGDEMEEFWGYNVLYNDASELDVTWTGTLNASESKTISGLYYNGSSETDNMFANSWTAPIHVGAIEDADLVNASKTLYMFNAGTPAQEEGHDGSNAANDNSDPGTYISIPIHSAPYAGIGVIPSMQAFYVEAQAAEASITLDYNKVVYTPALTSVGIVPNRAPKHNAEVVEPDVIKLHVQSETGWGANTYVLSREDFAEGYEDGWDGAYIEGESATPKLYTPSIDGNMFINCLPEIEGTVVGFRKGSSDNNYIFSFDYDGDEVWYLNDQKAQKSTQIMNGQTYAFVSEAGDNAARFVISATPINKIATGCESVGAEAAKVRKLIINDKVYIIRGGQVFDVLGKTIKK